MEDRSGKTADMLIHQIEWGDIADELGIKERTLFEWRKSRDPNKNEAIDFVINRIRITKETERSEVKNGDN